MALMAASLTHAPANAQTVVGSACKGSGYTEKATGTSSTGPLGSELNSTSTPIGGTYCVDYTIYKDGGSNPDTGYIEFGVIVKKVSNTTPNNSNPGNFEVIGFAPHVYSNINGVPIPAGGTAAVSAPERTLLSSNITSGLTMDGDDGMIKGNLTPGKNGLSFTFVGTTGATVTVDGFTASNSPNVTVSSGPNPCPSVCRLASTFSTTVNTLSGNENWNVTGIVSAPIGDAPHAPEIDGAKLPRALLLLSLGYLIVFRLRRRPEMNAPAPC